MMLTRRSLLARTALVAVSPLILPQRPSLGAAHGTAVPLVEHNLPLKDLATTGSIGAGSNQLVLASNPGFRVGDHIIVEIGGESGAGLRGAVGVGGVWPIRFYPNIRTMNADNGYDYNANIYARLPNGDVYHWMQGAWHAPDPNLYYTTKAIPRSLVAAITGISGTTLTLNKTALVATTNAGVYFDNAPLASTGGDDTINTIPAGKFAMSQAWWIQGTNVTLKGAGKNSTTIWSPNGIPSQAIRVNASTGCKVSDLHILGNARANGFGLLIEDGTDRLVDGGYVLGGVFFDKCMDCEARNIKGTDIFQRTAGANTSTNVWCYNCDCIMTEALQTYIQWQFGHANSKGGGCVDCTVTCDYLMKGFQNFQCTGLSLIRCGGTNCMFEANSSGGWLYEDLYSTITPNSQYSQLSISNREPILNVNTNQNPGFPSISLGGIIRRPKFVTQGYINAAKDYMRAIVVNVNNPNVQITGTYPNTPSPKGYIQHPNYVGGALGGAGSGVSSTGANTTVDGIRVVGTAQGSPWGNIHVENGIVRNCVADLITGGTQTNNQTNAAYIARGGR